MNCQASIPGPRGNRNWFDESPATPPKRPPQLRTVALLVAAFFVAVGALAVGGGWLLQWWRGA